jgi:hypothetical protein
LKYPGWDEVQDVPPVPDAYGVTGVMAALISRDAVVSLRKDIYNLTLSFVAPLDAYDCEVLFH